MAEGRTAWPKTDDEWFVEPIASTEFLLAREDFKDLAILDPACGQGNIVTTCRAAGLDAWGTDIRERIEPRAPWFLGRRDFLIDGLGVLGSEAIITNPPYGHAKTAEAFIRRALATPSVRKTAMFVNAKFLFGAGRARGLFKDHPPSRVWPVSPRPSCPPGALLRDGLIKATGGVENYVWMVWDHDAPAGTTFHWNADLPDAARVDDRAMDEPQIQTPERAA